ncbi:Uncharacterized protein FKW44_002163, partial [Caligus rogercresseyi]
MLVLRWSNTWEMKIIPGSLRSKAYFLRATQGEVPSVKPHSLVLQAFSALNCEENVLGYKRNPTSSARTELSFTKYHTTPATRSPSRKSLAIHVPSGANSGESSTGSQHLIQGSSSSKWEHELHFSGSQSHKSKCEKDSNPPCHQNHRVPRDDIVPELTKNSSRHSSESEDSPKLHHGFGRHFCSEVHAENEEKKFKVYHLIVKSQH